MPGDLPDIRLRGDELIGEAALKDLLVIEDLQRLEEAQKRIDNHISRQSLAIENGTWPVSRPLPDFQKESSYPVQEALPHWWEFDSVGYPEQTTVVRNVLPTRKKRISMTQTRVKRSEGAKLGTISLPNFRSKEPDGPSRLFLGITSPANFTVPK